MESGFITNEQFEYKPGSYSPGHEPYKARLRGSSAYCTPSLKVGWYDGWYDTIQFKLDLVDEYKITGFALQVCGTLIHFVGGDVEMWIVCVCFSRAT